MPAPRNDDGLAARLRSETRDLHRVAEQSGVMRDLLRGRLDRDRYTLLLRNLQPIYDALEKALSRHADNPAIAALRADALYRTPSLDADLRALCGADWERTRPLAMQTTAYLERLCELDATAPERLVAHAYVRYLGDLSGGQILREIVQQAFALGELGTAFYRFDGADARALARRFREGLDAIVATDATIDAIVDEARGAFARHVALFEELARVQGISAQR